MRNSFNARVGLISLFLSLFLFISPQEMVAQCPSTTVSGTVFIDNDLDGDNDPAESGYANLQVRVFDAEGVQRGQALSNNSGAYSISNLVDGQSYRVEFAITGDVLVSNFGSDNDGDVQFVTVPQCAVDLGVTEGNTTCNNGTEIFLSCFVNGQAGNNPDQETIIGLVNSFNSSSSVQVYATQGETGSVWGMTYKEATQEIFSSAFVKQHSGLAAGGHDAIYKTDLSGTNPTTTVFTKLSALGQNVGTLSTTNHLDCTYGSNVGKVGLGGLVLDASGDNLYVVNLFNNSVVRIDANNPTTSTTQAYSVPSPGCSYNDFLVFGLKEYNGSIYVGVTCTGETSLDENDTSIHVYELNPNSGNFTLVFSDDYSQGVWSADNLAQKRTMHWLTDMEFTSNGNMILALSDRIGHAFCDDLTSRVDDQNGDLLIAAKTNNGWVLESNGAIPGAVGSGVNNGQGPDGGEFFGEDYFPGNPSDHPEITIGSVYILPNSDVVVAAVFDPAISAYSGGLHRYDTNNGTKVSSIELYNQNISTYFGKATGFGDITAGCGPLSAQIGNYVWFDNNCNGVQDADEPGMANAALTLYDENCSVVSSTTTDSRGFYSFTSTDGIYVGEQYYVVLDASSFDVATGLYDFNGSFFVPTLTVGNNNINSNFTIGGACSALDYLPNVSVVAGSGNDTGFDLGLKPSTDFDLALSKVLLSDPNPKFGDIVEFEITVFNQGTVPAASFTVTDYLTQAYEFVATSNPDWNYDGSDATLDVNTPLQPNQVYKKSIFLRLMGSNNIQDFVNAAEISATLDSNGQENSDSDSTADNIRNNDNGGVAGSNTDNLVSDDGAIDEDDHDSEVVNIFDLALTKVNRDNRAYDEGEVVTFDITVYNQGNVDAQEFTITDNFPTELIFTNAGNQGWTVVGNGLVEYTYNQVLAAGESVVVSVSFTVGDVTGDRQLMNYAEISSATSTDNVVREDFDSVPDADMFNDTGGVPNSTTDGEIFDHGTDDEDDQDPASVSVRLIDLALIKTTKQRTFNLGDIVIFTIEIHNQGTAAIGKLSVVDYLPEDMILVDNSWTLDASTHTATKEIVFISGLQPGQVYTDQISVLINSGGHAGAYVNVAEISKVYDIRNNDISSADIDSNADAINGNDSGGMPVTAMDDYLDGTGLDDEDDSDPALIFVPSIVLQEECTCLNNATNGQDGQFRDVVAITSVSGEDWFLDSAFDVFNITSAPGVTIPYPTGPTGVQFAEVPNGDGTSNYTLRIKVVSGGGYSLRATNGNGAFLQISGGGEACTYCQPVVNSAGLGAVCSGSTHTYEAEVWQEKYENCENYIWFLEGDGEFVDVPPGVMITGSGTGTVGSGFGLTSVTIEWGNNPGPRNLTFIPSCPDICVAPVSLAVEVGSGEGLAMACVNELNISLGDGCQSILSADQLLVSDPEPNVVYQLMLTDANGELINNNRVTEAHLWSQLTAKVINPCSGNSCWATINVEDKRAPQIQCDDIELPCYLVNSYEPIVLDACSTSEFTLVQETTTPLTCDDPYLKVVHRTFTAVDGFGNVSAPCTQNINVLPLDYDAIVIPDGFLENEGTALSCVGLELDDNGFPHPSITGIPTINGFPLFPITDLYCNAGIDYRDILVSELGCTKKIMRTWTIYDGCDQPFRRTQTIEISDSRAPWVECPMDITIGTDGGPGCQADFTLPLPTISDDCTTDNFEIDLKYANGFLQNITSAQTLTFAATDSTEVTYLVYDECGNLASCSFDVFVMDEVTPTAICDQNSVVSLRLDGTAKAFPQTFDDGSFDDCGLFNTLIRRMNNDCDCDRPQFKDLQYLGARGSNPASQRHYYLSRFQRPGFIASGLAAAYGGTLLTLESEAEHQWVFDQVNAYAPGAQYLIGLQDKVENGTFIWENHIAPMFEVWADGSPIADDGDYVIVDVNGEWRVVDNEPYAFVLEVSNNCGFSEEIPFCCADAGQEQMVVLRAIDNFGGYNDCMVTVEVQDKVPPQIFCPDDQILSCTDIVDVNNLTSFGFATATDSCVDDEITVVATEDRTICGVGTIVRTFTAVDANGGASCEQTLRFENNEPFDFANIIWPLDFDTDQGCNFASLHPDNLDFEFAYPQFPGTDRCDLLDATFRDQTFSFAGPGSTACLKILRQWTVIDWCQLDADGVPMSDTYDQTIKVENTAGPDIDATCTEQLEVVTLECLEADVTFQVSATDDCTDASSLKQCVSIDLNSDGAFEVQNNCEVGGTVFFQNKLSLGNHIVLISFEDLCGNVSTCAKPVRVVSEKAPTAYCIESLSVALEPWDTDGDGVADNELACITPALLDNGSTHLCNDLIRQQNALLPAAQQLDTIAYSLSFCESSDPNEICFDCRDRDSTRTIALCIIDEFGQQSTCNVRINVQDNNNINACPVFDLALIKELTPGSPACFNPGEDVTFRLAVLNQGTVDAFNVQIAEYLPQGFILNDPDWALFPGTNTAILNTPIDSISAGWNKSVEITVTIDPNTMVESITNFAEIIGSTNPMNLPDEDSVADTSQTNDNFRNDSDNVVSEDGTNGGDEDDHDFETVVIKQNYDLALTKILSADQPDTFVPGEEVCFDVSVINQGTLDATNVTIDDNIPAGLTFNSGSPWTLSGSLAQATIPFVAANGGAVTTQICFIIQDGFMGQCLINVAEISGQGEMLTDNDSTPGNDDGDQSEDDEDSAKVAVGQVFDLALRKVVAPGGPASYSPGDIVTYNIEIFNQGTLDATNVIVQDYVPDDLIFVVANNSGWNANATFNVASVPAGTDTPVVVSVNLEISPTFVGSSILNDAEIIAADNALNLPDVDSTPGNDETPDDTNDNDDITDTNGGDDQDPEVINVVCDIPPVCNIVPQITVSLDTFGMASVMVSDLDNGSLSVCDNLPPSVEIITDSTFGCGDLFCVTNATQVVSILVTDQLGNTSSCSSTVTVEDNIAPFFECSDVTVPLNMDGTPNIDFNEVVSNVEGFSIQDNCIGAIPSFGAVGSMPCVANPTTYTLTDQCGLSTTCTFNVFLENDPPVAICQDVTINIDANGMAVVMADLLNNGSTDDCGIDTVEASPTSFDCTQVGVSGLTTVLTITDISGSTSTAECSVTVGDVTPPVAICQNGTVCLDANGLAILDPLAINSNSTDNCPSNLQFSLDQTNFTCDDLANSPIPVTLTVSDGVNSSTTTSCSVTVTDKEAPVIVCQDATIFLDPESVTLEESMILVSVSDNSDECGITTAFIGRTTFNCDDLDTTVTNVPGCPGLFDVTLVATDAAGNTAECTQTVSVQDNTIAECTGIVDVDIMLLGAGATASVTVDASTLFTVVNNCNTQSTFEPSSFTFDCDDIGDNPLTVTVGDGCGHTTVCNTIIEILDGAPQCEAISDITLSVDETGNRVVEFSDIDDGSSAGCDGSITFGPTDFDCEDVGTTTSVVITVTPLSGVVSTCSTNVTITDDIDPVVTCLDRTVSLDEDGLATIDADFLIDNNNTSDNCPGLMQMISRSEFNCADLEDTGMGCMSDDISIVVTVTDAQGNSATCTSIVNVRDVEAPTCPTPAVIQQVNLLGAGMTATGTIAANEIWSPTDNCSNAFTFSPSDFSFDCLDIGVNSVTAVVTDECQQQSTCIAQVEVVDSAPQCLAIPDVTFNLDANGNFNVTLADVDAGSSAGCDGDITISPTFFACNNIGLDNCVTITVTPQSGMALTCKTNVTIVDQTAPVLTCDDLTINLDESTSVGGNLSNIAQTITADDLNLTIFDCDTLSINLSQSVFDCVDLMSGVAGCANDIDVNITVTDVSGNSSICVSTVTVVDAVAPVCEALQNVITPLIMSGNGMLSVTIDPLTLIADYDDNCDDVNFNATVMPATFDCTNVNNTEIVTITVEDQCGLTSTCEGSVTIVENSAPTCLVQDVTVPLDGSSLCLDPSVVDAGSNAGCGAPVTLDVSPNKFDCSNLGANVVTLTVSTTPPGTIQSASCTATVTIVDNALPTITCPADTSVICNTSLFNPNLFGTPTAEDGCNAQVPSITSLTPVLNVNACNVGVMTRTFIASDVDGNQASCTQIVTIDPPVNPLTAANITFPESPFVLDSCIVDPNNVDSGMPIVDTSNIDCSLISISSVTVDPTPNSGMTCVNELERTFTVIDSCQLNTGTGAGIFTFTQTIILNDLQGPDITCPNDTLVFLPVNSTDCEVLVNLPATISDCTGVIAGSNNSPFANDPNSSDATGLYPAGTTIVTVTGEDNCGNVSTCEYEVMVVDTSATFDSCKKLIVNLGTTGMVTVNSIAACPEITSICPDTSFTVSWSLVDPNVIEMDFDCADQTVGISSMYTLYLYSGNELLDSCSNILQVLDPFSVCPQPFTNGTIAGRIQTEDSRMVSAVEVRLNSMDIIDETDIDGLYAFSEVPFGNPYQIVPSKDVDPMNGISTLDLVLIQRHILSIEHLDSPYKLIAADINKSNKIDGIDLVELRKLILGISTDFAENTSWRMVDAAYQFADETNPFGAYFPEQYVVRDLTSDMDIDFIGVKIGDVNGDVIANLNDVVLDTRRADAVKISANEVLINENALVDVDFSIEESVDGFQFTLGYDTDKLTLVGVHSRSRVLLDANYHVVKPGTINFSWHSVFGAKQVDLSDVFSMRFVSHTSGRLSDYISISADGLNPEAYTDGDIAELRLDLNSELSQEFEVYQNTPNPWTTATVISFNLPIGGSYSLEVLNTDGKLVCSRNGVGTSGLNTIELTKSDLSSGGVYYYVVSSNNARKTQKMLFVR